MSAFTDEEIEADKRFSRTALESRLFKFIDQLKSERDSLAKENLDRIKANIELARMTTDLNEKVETLERERDEARDCAWTQRNIICNEKNYPYYKLPWEQPTQDKQEGRK